MFITFEGVEGAGKSTLAALLAAKAEALGHTVLRTREPGGCPLGLHLRPLLLGADQKLDARAELMLFLADRAQHVAEVIRPALAKGYWLMCDRYADSTIAYQGYGRGMDVEWLQQANHFATGGLWPQRTFLLDLPPHIGLQRARLRNQAKELTQAEGRFEAEELAFHQRIRQGFLQRASQYPERFCILDATQNPEELAQTAWKFLF